LPCLGARALREAGLGSSVRAAGLLLPPDLSGTQSALSGGVKPGAQKCSSDGSGESRVPRQGQRVDLGNLRLCVSPDTQCP